jgi:hypothetical protein
MLEFYKAWIAKHPDYKFLFVTKDDMQQVHQHCQELEIKTTDILSAVANRYEVPIYLKLADLGIFFIKPAYSKKASSAVKMGEIMAMGLPFVTNKGVGDQDIIIKQSSFGSITELHDMKLSDITFGRKMRLDSNISSIFSLKNGISQYENAYYNIK